MRSRLGIGNSVSQTRRPEIYKGFCRPDRRSNPGFYLPTENRCPSHCMAIVIVRYRVMIITDHIILLYLYLSSSVFPRQTKMHNTMWPITTLTKLAYSLWQIPESQSIDTNVVGVHCSTHFSYLIIFVMLYLLVLSTGDNTSVKRKKINTNDPFNIRLLGTGFL